MFATCWNAFGACWKGFEATYRPTGLMGRVGAEGCMLQVLWGAMKPIWGCMLATYMSYGAQ